MWLLIMCVVAIIGLVILKIVICVYDNMEKSQLTALRTLKYGKKKFNKDRMRKYLLENPMSTEEIEELVNIPTVDLIKKLNEKTLNYERVLLAFRHKAYEVDKRLNCVVTFLFPNIHETNLNGPLAGLPVSLKDNFSIKGYDSHLGCARLINKPSSDDCVVAKLIKNLGGIIFVKTTVSYTMMSVLGSNPIDGDTLNPYNIKRTAGGSSAGEAALIASRGSPLGFGNDLGGSIRIPAAFCGICGFKPTQGLLSRKGIFSPVQFPLVFEMCGPMSQDVQSLIEILRMMTNSPRHYELDRLLRPSTFNEQALIERKLRIGYLYHESFFIPVPAMERAVSISKKYLEQRGHELVQFRLPYSLQKTYTLYMKSIMADSGNNLLNSCKNDKKNATLTLLGRSKLSRYWLYAKTFLSSDFDGLIAISASAGQTIHEELSLISEIENATYEMTSEWDQAGLDALILPVLGTPAIPLKPSGSFTGALAYSSIFNVLNFPAGTVPVGRVEKEDLEEMINYPEHNKWHKNVKSFQNGTEGLPIGVQVAALPFRDEVCLFVMKEIEKIVQNSMRDQTELY